MVLVKKSSILNNLGQFFAEDFRVSQFYGRFLTVFFFVFKSSYLRHVRTDGRTQGRTHGRTDAHTDGRTNDGSTPHARTKMVARKAAISTKNAFIIRTRASWRSIPLGPPPPPTPIWYRGDAKKKHYVTWKWWSMNFFWGTYNSPSPPLEPGENTPADKNSALFFCNFINGSWAQNCLFREVLGGIFFPKSDFQKTA